MIVISNDAYHRTTTDMVVVAMTSNPASVEYGFVIHPSDLDQGRLNRSGTVRVDKIYTLSQSLIVASFGRINSDTLNKIREVFLKLVATKR